ncbi:MAG: pentapeptide repeat-containing protein [Rhizobiaceae bacterium]
MTNADPFKRFENWSKEYWGQDASEPEPLTEKQQKIVSKNIRLLLDAEKWEAEVEAFESSLEALKDPDAALAKRSDFHVRFDACQLDDSLKDVSNYRFPCDVSFNDAKFGDGYVSFNNAKFGDGYVSFNNAKFGDGKVSFNNAIFGDGNVWFHDAKFGDGEVSFNDAKFGDGDVWFNDAIFGDVYVWFNNAKFGDGNVSFNGAEFGDGKVSFMDAKFGDGNVLFVDLSLSSTSMAASAMEVEGNLYVKSLFPQHSDFSQLRVNGTASFLGSKFAEVPDFRNAHFVRPPEVAAMRVEPPKMHRKPGALFIHASNQDDVHKYRKLKGMAQAAHDHEKDGEFFAFEMMAKRGWETTTWWELLANTIYYRVSGYGQRYDLPMLGLIISWFIFGLGNLSLAGDPAALSERIKFAFAYSFNNTVPFLGSLRRFVGQPEEHISHFDKVFTDIASSGANIDLMVSVAVLQQLIGLLLLFFVLLGLRTRFRLK